MFLLIQNENIVGEPTEQFWSDETSVELTPIKRQLVWLLKNQQTIKVGQSWRSSKVFKNQLRGVFNDKERRNKLIQTGKKKREKRIRRKSTKRNDQEAALSFSDTQEDNESESESESEQDSEREDGKRLQGKESELDRLRSRQTEFG